MSARWHNWSGSVVCHPERIVEPRDFDEVIDAVRAARETGRTLRTVGTGHSSNGIVGGDEIVLSTKGLCGLVRVDRTKRIATVRAGTTLEALGHALYEHDLALPNYGDVATQTIGGAIGTGTHGAGRTQHNLSQLMVGARIVAADGSIVSIGRDDPELVDAARVALGSFGVYVEVDLQCVPAFDVERREYACPTDTVLANLDALVDGNRSFDFYWYPRRDDAKIRLVNPVGGGSQPPARARLLERREGYGHLLIPTHSGIPHRFEEMEYCVPYDAGPACFRDVRARMIARWRPTVAWRVLYRTIAADRSDLSPAHGRDTVTISLHQNASLPWKDFFDDIEPIFRAHGGRPHWAKKHSLTARELAPLYPRWSHFARVREWLDPEGMFLSPYLRALLVDDASVADIARMRA